MRKFQLIILILFILFAAAGVFFFASFKGSDDIKDIKINIWGVEETSVWNKFSAEFNINTDRIFNLEYKHIEGDFIENVVEAIASGNEPDIIILSSKDLLSFQDKILPIPYSLISERGFKDAFIEGGEAFLTKEGILGLPFSVDPMVMYWNRDILQSNAISSPPSSWAEFFPFAERLTVKDDALNVTKSALAMGEFVNINNAKEIIFSLMLQNGNNVIERDIQTGSFKVVLSENFGAILPPAESTIKFYTEFSNPTKTSYSWNRSLPNSLDFFSSGDLGLYFGLASELSKIKIKNPNLNFDVAMFPQASVAENKKVYGEIKALVVLKRSKNTNVAISAASALVAPDSIKSWSSATKLPPVRRSLLAVKPGLAFEDLFYQSALISEPFLDPDYEKSNLIFKDLIERVVSGRERISQAIRRSTTELNSLIVDKKLNLNGI